MPLDRIPSNFDTSAWLNVTEGHDAECHTGEGEGKLRFSCSPNHLNRDDPILFPGQPGKATHRHLHHWFGNTEGHFNSNYKSLRLNGLGTCQGGPVNRSAYWMHPLMKDIDGVPHVVRPANITMYYAIDPLTLVDFETPSDNPAFEKISRAATFYPPGFQDIHGWDPANPTYATGVWGREDTSNGTVGTLLRDQFQATLADLVAECPSSAVSGEGYRDNIFARSHSPTCWDGVNLTSANGRSHVAYPVQDGFGNLVCPAGYPYRLPERTQIVWYSHNGDDDILSMYCSADPGWGYDHGHTSHSGFIPAWDPIITGSDGWPRHILAIGTGDPDLVKTANSGILCYDNKQLTLSVLDSLPNNGWGGSHRPENERYLLPPPLRKYSAGTFSV